MRNGKLIGAFLLFVFVSTSVLSQEKNGKFEKVKGFSHPESVVLDEERQVLYVSNIGNDTPGDGFISRIAVDGEITELKWITGLNDPKGLLVSKGKLFVADNTELVEIDIDKATVSRKEDVEGAELLNDITMDEQGVIYISDTRKGSIYTRNPDGEIKEWLQNEKLESPNGLLSVDNLIYVAAWGSGEPGNVLTVDKRTQEINAVTTSGIGNLDGIQRSGKGEFLISDWNSGNIHTVDQQGNFTKLVTSAKSVGDILLLQENKLLILPMNIQNEVWWYSLDQD